MAVTSLLLLLPLALGLLTGIHAQAGEYQQCGGIGWSVMHGFSTQTFILRMHSPQDWRDCLCQRFDLHEVERL